MTDCWKCRRWKTTVPAIDFLVEKGNAKNITKRIQPMNSKGIILSLTLALISVFSLTAQPPGEDLETGEVEVIRDFDARLEETEKLVVEPQLPEYQKGATDLIYTIPIKILALEYPAPKIRPIAMGRDKEPEVYRGYAKAGFGTFSQPYGELGYHYNDEKQFDLNAHLLHHSGSNNNNIENQRFSFTGGQLDGTYYTDEGVAINGRTGYQSDVQYLYGYDQADTSFLKEEVRRRINLLELGGSIFNSAETLAGINYEARADFYRLNESFGASKETGFIIDLSGTKYIGEEHPLNVRLITDFSTFTDTATQDLHNFYLQPNFTYHGERFKVKIGANVVSHEDDFFLFPDVEAEAGIIGNQLGAFVGWEGSLQKNNFRNLIEYNPFVSSRLIVENAHYNNWYGGVRGSFNDFGYEAQVGFKQVDNLATFLPLPDDQRQFQVLYDTADIFYIQGMIGGPVNEQLELTATLGQNFFSTQVGENAWHLPSLEANFSALYTAMEGKLKLRGEFYVADGVPFLNEELESERLNALFDVSLGAEYLFNDRIGAWLQLNNLADNKRERWQNYPIFGFNVMAGAVARF